MRLHTLLLFAAALVLPAAAQDDEAKAAAPAQSQELAEGWDFVPGERLLLYDDFTDMVKGGAPPHWKVRGGSVKLGSSGRLIVNQEIQLYPNVVSWPKNFTIESDVTIKGSNGNDLTWSFLNGDGERILHFWSRCSDEEGKCSGNLDSSSETGMASAEFKYAPGQPNTLNIWMQDGRIRIYWNKDRIVDVNQVKLEGFTQVELSAQGSEETTYTFGRFRIAESAPDVSQTILATGRYVTHGIQFDVNSDRLKPESMTVIREIAGALQKQPALKLRIEGHTDSSGDAAKNLDLSKRRAESVKNALVSLGIGADRLTAQGLGATKPAASNDTPDGRANNRRVEFVKI